ncbi:Uncharacterised protein [Mycobacterium tuberculosis]|nr:Uncharacterised protein [Mycobacterium tuberculosis]CNX84409.1 Uncharacterised protein [Mycobacterium tuberculosis]CNX87704.1 Uncharacterised protein [Mycobacterium tuberculosis]CNX99443.1 Uncharacterised protein [Mycobacterium tuberculosis]CNY02695.1 Uncharacterised protein [Mycobacterium tuberculosis]
MASLPMKTSPMTDMLALRTDIREINILQARCE